MAYVKFSNNKGQKVTSAQAMAILDVLEGRAEPTDGKQAKFIETVQRVYLPWRDCDADYIANNASYILPIILGDWKVNRQGIPTQPDSKDSWAVAHRMYLWQHGGPSPLARSYIDKWPAARSYASSMLSDTK